MKLFMVSGIVVVDKATYINLFVPVVMVVQC